MDTIALKRRFKHILASLLAIDDSILVDIMADLYDDNAIEADFSEFVSNTAVDSKNNLAFVALMAITIRQKKRQLDDNIRQGYQTSCTILR